MHIDWWALVVVAAVSIVASVAFTVLLASGIRSVASGRALVASGQSAGARLPFGYTLLGLAGLLVLYGLYLIVPQFH